MESGRLLTDKWIETKIKGDRVKVTLNEIEIYKSLRDYGLRFSYIDRSGYLYFRQHGIEVTSLLRIKDLVYDTLETGEFPNRNLTLNAYLAKNPIKKGEAFKHILRDNLTDDEKQVIKSQVGKIK